MKSDPVLSTRSQKWFYFTAKLVGFAPFSLKDDKLGPVTSLNKIYNVILIAFTVAATLTKLYQVAQFVNTQYFLLYLMASILNIGVTVSCLVLLTFRSDVFIGIIRRIHAAEGQLRRRQNTKKEENIFKSRAVKVVAINVVASALRIFIELSTSRKHYRAGWTELNIFEVVMKHFYRLNTILIFAHVVDYVNKSFERLNSELQGLFRSDCESLACRDDNRFVADQTPIRYLEERIAAIRVLHKELCDVLQYTTEAFTAPLLWVIQYHFFRLLLVSFSVYKHVSSSMDFMANTRSSSFTEVYIIAETLLLATEIYCLTNVCAAACQMGNKTKVVLHQVWNKFRSMELKDEVSAQFFIFSVQLLRNRVVVSVLGIVDLDYSYPYEVFCASLGYFIVMIQFKEF